MALPIVSGQTRPMTVRGTVIHVKLMSNIEREEYFRGYDKLDRSKDFYRAATAYLAEKIDRIEGYDAPVAETLGQLSGDLILAELIAAINNASNLSEDEQKNLGSSSAGHASAPSRITPMTAAARQAIDAGPIEK